MWVSPREYAKDICRYLHKLHSLVQKVTKVKIDVHVLKFCSLNGEVLMHISSLPGQIATQRFLCIINVLLTTLHSWRQERITCFDNMYVHRCLISLLLWLPHYIVCKKQNDLSLHVLQVCICELVVYAV